MADGDFFALPSYEAARLPDAWPYVLPFLRRPDLISFSLVSKKFQRLAQGTLWSEPRRFWPKDEADVVDNFMRFQRSLDTVRISPRAPHLYVQTLDLSYLKSEYLSSHFPNGWASRLFEQLKNLRSFIVTHTSAFDHNSIGSRVASHEKLRLLCISACPNLTFKALAKLLKSFANLYYLEISDCPTAKHADVLEAIAELSKLAILKIPRGGFRGDDIKALAIYIIRLRADSRYALPQNLRCLDIRDNDLSDAVVESLSRWGEALPSEEEPPPYDADFLGDIESSQLIGSPQGGWSDFFEARIRKEDTPAPFNEVQDHIMRQVRDDGFRSPVELGDLGDGITHLYLSGNKFSGKGISALVEALPLEKLDVGDLHAGSSQASPVTASSSADLLWVHQVLESLFKCPTLKSLRIDHRIVTGFAGAEQSMADNVNAQEESPYPYSFLRLQGTQWDPAVRDSQRVKMFQFSPALLALRTLELTSVPTSSSSEALTECLKAFLEAAADMQRVASLYESRRSPNAKQDRATQAIDCALEELQLAMFSTPTMHSDRYDADTEVYDAASQADFSFFPDEKDAYVSTHRMGRTTSRGASPTTPAEKAIDTVATLTAFRRRQREETAQAAHGSKKASAMWSGKLKVIRKP